MPLISEGDTIYYNIYKRSGCYP